MKSFRQIAKSCASYRKSVRRDVLEGDFERVLAALEPSETLYKVARAMFRDIWILRLAQTAEVARDIQARLKGIEKQIDQLLDRIVEASNASVIAAYEKKIASLGSEKAIAQESLVRTGRPRHPLEESFELALTIPSSLWKIWKNSGLGGRRRC